MKKLLAAFILIISSASLKAEYMGYHISFIMELENGQRASGYAYVTEAYLNLDSLGNSEYLKKALDQSWKEWMLKDSLTYFEARVKYEYRIEDGGLGEKRPIYFLTNKRSIPLQNIKLIRVDDIFEYTYLIGISNELTMADTTWLKKEPIKYVSIEGYLCYHLIFIHADSKKIREVVSKIGMKQKELGGIEIDFRNGDAIDEEIWQILRGLDGEKVVVISECTD